MVKICLVVFYVCVLNQVNSIYYDTFRGVIISKEELLRHVKANTTSWCTADISPCNPAEGRRIDGSCSHLDKPTSGVAHTPVRRLLPAYFSGDYEIPSSKSGEPLPLPRVARTTTLPAGKLPSTIFTQLVSYIFVHIFSDVASIHDSVTYIIWKTHCCLPEGKNDKQCAPNIIPIDDPVHRFSGIRCMNLTKPMTFQDMDCAPKGTTPMRIISSTPLIDLSVVYGNSLLDLNKSRTFYKGLLRYEFDNENRMWPPSKNELKDSNEICRLNQLPHETRCHDIPKEGNNALLGQNLFLVWSWRHHNKIAERLAALNPCWDDEKLFYTARDINIAYTLQVFFYELVPTLLGRKNILKNGLISANPGFRDLYKEYVDPLLSVEYAQALRWLHTIQETSVKMFDPDGYYLKQFPMTNFTLRTGYLANNIDYVTQGAFRQRGANHDHMIDPDMSELVLGPHQRAADVATSDLHKNRLVFLQPYVKYLELCYGKPFKSFEDLRGHIDEARIQLLKGLYKDVEDIDLTVGMWLEENVLGGFVPPTFYCIVVEQWTRNIESDRHWYERPNRPNAFTLEQLLEIRKASMSEWLCEVGDKVSKIQRKAFLVAGIGNEIRSCEEIQKVDYSVWKDATCQK